jgi:hypothetical protein
MPQTKAQPTKPARKAPARKRPAAGKAKPSRAAERTTELSDEVLKSLESGQRSAIDAVHTFIDTVDAKLPSLGDEHPSRRQDIIDAALEMADRLVQTQYDFLRKVVHGAGKALSKPGEEK